MENFCPLNYIPTSGKSQQSSLGTIILGIIGDDKRKQERMFDLWTMHIYSYFKDHPTSPLYDQVGHADILYMARVALSAPTRWTWGRGRGRGRVRYRTGNTFDHILHGWDISQHFFCRSHLMAFKNMKHKISSSSPWKPSKNAVTCFPKRFICATLSSFSSLLSTFGYFLSLIYESRCPPPSMRWRDLLVDKKRREFWSRILSMLTDRNTVKCLRKKVSSRFLHHCTMCSL